MAESPPQGSRAPAGGPREDRLESWKEIAAYMRRDVTTVQRWEKREGMPVRRHVHDKLGSVYAFRSDLDAWAKSRSGAAETDGGGAAGPPAERRAGASGGEGQAAPAAAAEAAAPRPAGARARRRWIAAAAAVLAAAGAAAIAGRAISRERAGRSPLADARFVPLTDFDGVEQAAAVSRDGRFVAFLSDRGGRPDVWMTQVGTGQFTNLTRGAAPELVNPSVRTLGFSPDGTLVTFWARTPGEAAPHDIGVWAAPLLGGAPRRYLPGVAEADWSRDGSRIVFHTPGPGDPMYVGDAARPDEARNVFRAPAGLHGHFPLWAPDGSFVYFVQGALPDRLDLWRLRPSGGEPERLTRHEALVSHPVFVGERTLLYLATDAEGLGPWIYALDVEERVPRRVSFGSETYTSLAASADGRTIVATRATPKRTLWRVPLDAGRAELSAARRIPLTTTTGSAPRFGPGYLVYVSPRGDGDGLWKLEGGDARELWSAPETRIVGGPAIRRDGRQIAFSARRSGRTSLHVVNDDGTGAREVAASLEVQGAPAWAPDGRTITIAAIAEGAPRLFQVPLDGRPPAPLAPEHSADPAWSPAGDVVAFTGPDVGTTFVVKALGADGAARPIPPLRLTRGARHLAFLPGGRTLLVLRGEIRHKDLWLVELDTGAERPVLDVGPEFDLRDFDVSPDGRELVLEQVQEHSDIVLVVRPAR